LADSQSFPIEHKKGKRMVTKSRRDFLKISASLAGAGAAASLFPDSIRKALAIEPNSVTGTINDVEHIVVFMQ
jgi:phospholipase C